MAAAADYLDRVGLEAIHEHEMSLTRVAMRQLSNVDGLRILGPASVEERAGVIPFVIDGTSAQDVATILDAQGIAVRAGHHCAQLAVDRYGLSATTRASFYLYNSNEEVHRLAQGVRTARDILLS